MSRCKECDKVISANSGDLLVPKKYRWEYCKLCIDRDFQDCININKVTEIPPETKEDE